MLELGLELSPSKGLESPRGVFEFCKRLIGPHGEYTPLGMKGLSMAIKSPAYLSNLFVDLHGKGYHFTSDVLKSLFSNPPKFIVKSERVRDRVLWSLLGTFGVLTHSINFRPGKILDFTVDRTVLEQFLDILHKVARKLATKDIIRDRISRDQFLSVLQLDRRSITDHGFHRHYVLSRLPAFFCRSLLELAIYFRLDLFKPVLWREFPSFNLCMKHVNSTRSTWVAEYYYLVDRYKLDGRPIWETVEGFLAAMTTVVNGAVNVLPPIMDFITSNRLPVVRLPERFIRY